MNTYVCEAPDYAQTEIVENDVRVVCAESPLEARKKLSRVWNCDHNDVCVLTGFFGTPIVIQGPEKLEW